MPMDAPQPCPWAYVVDGDTLRCGSIRLRQLGFGRRWALLFAAVMLSACEQRPWQGWVYPDANDFTDDISIGGFASLEECRASAKAVLTRTEERRHDDGEPIKGDYECGLKCKPGPGALTSARIPSTRLAHSCR